MSGLFEKSDSLHMPIECFVFDAAREEFPVRPHWHYFAEFIYMLDGSAKMRCGDRSYTLHTGETILFHPSAVHSIYSADESRPKYAVLKFDINRLNLTPAYAPKLGSIFRYAEKKGMQILFDRAESEKLACGRIWSACLAEFTDYQYGRDLVLQSYLYELLMNIVRFWLARGMTIDTRRIPQTEDCAIDNITEYIDRLLSENLRVADLAEQCGLSYSCFAKKFREQYGMSCKQYIERMRLYKAEEFLLFTDFDLNYISQETGFSDCSHFIKSFKKYKGVTPKQFRRKASS
ncbi:MAG: AraC family transcriptional regulator [Bacteroidales bacterium]|nr:AraC family transcriptional regulator [Bacteroidales bacterium]MCM1417004.1 AraC family transcriptional regulator [bacterium]MCM1424484.1 AraC family transcriptional regulator [bacterium]